MSQKVVPMIHVPDVRATVDWYQSIGFTVIETFDDGGDGLSFAILSFGSSEVMFSSGGQSSGQYRREVDLYVYESANLLAGNAPQNTHWHYEKMVEEKHSTIYHPAALKAFRELFKPHADCGRLTRE